MSSLQEQTIGQTVTKDYRTAQISRNFGLDFCCGGDKTIEEACVNEDVDPQQVYQSLEALCEESTPVHHNYDNWELDFLIDYIVNNHHEFSRSKLSEINQYARKVANAHGHRHKELIEIYHEFTMMHSEIFNHLDKEERILFPYIKLLVEAQKNGTTPEEPEFGEAANPIAMMEEEHDDSGEAMAKIRRLSNDFTTPADACTTYRLLYENLEAFEKDLHKHVHLENNILFPKALKLEDKEF